MAAYDIRRHVTRHERKVQVNAHVETQRSCDKPTVYGSLLHLFLYTCNSISSALKSKYNCISAHNSTLNKWLPFNLRHLALAFTFVCLFLYPAWNPIQVNQIEQLIDIIGNNMKQKEFTRWLFHNKHHLSTLYTMCSCWYRNGLLHCVKNATLLPDKNINEG